MKMKKPFLINPNETADPLQDKRWVPDGEDMWFLPYVLDRVNNTYSGYWYGVCHSFEEQHYHTGIAQGTVLQGKMRLECEGGKLTLKKQDSFLLPPHTIHSADLIPNEKGFLIFGIIVGKTHYLSGSEILDVDSYYDKVVQYYSNNKVSMENIFVSSR
jgi:hypothetical protein